MYLCNRNWLTGYEVAAIKITYYYVLTLFQPILFRCFGLPSQADFCISVNLPLRLLSDPVLQDNVYFCIRMIFITKLLNQWICHINNNTLWRLLGIANSYQIKYRIKKGFWKLCLFVLLFNVPVNNYGHVETRDGQLT